MWDLKEKNMVVGDQSTSLNSASLRSSFLGNVKASSTVNSFNGHLLAEASGKRKAMDLDPGGDLSDSQFTKYWGNLRGNSGHKPIRETGLQHNVSADDAIGFQEKYSGINSGLLSARSCSSQPYHGHYQLQNINYSSMSFQREDNNLQRAEIGSSNPQLFHHKEQSLNKTFVGDIPNLPAPHHLGQDTAIQSEGSKVQYYSNQIGGSMKETLPVPGPKNGMNWHQGNYKLSSNPSLYSWNMTSSSFTFLESPHPKMADDRIHPCGGNYVRNTIKNELTEVKKKVQDIGFGEDISLSTANFVQISDGSGREKSLGCCKNSNSEKRSINNLSSNALGAHLDIRAEEPNLPIMLRLPVLAESSDSKQASLVSGMVDNNAFVSKDFDKRTVKKENEPTAKTNDQSVGPGSPLKCDALCDRKPSELGGGPTSLSLDDQSKSEGGKASQVIIEKLWDGSLQLNTSTRVSVVAFFKSGEKAQDINWSEHIEVKGKVRLQAFEKFIQELPRSRSRAMMVISLCWKVGSSKDGLKSMKEVSKGYKDNERVGFAQISPGIDLYVCPRSDTIITILAKYGFFKGMTAVEEDQDSLIGCVIWRRGWLSLKSGPLKLEKKENPLPEQPLNSPEFSNAEINSPLVNNHDSESKQATVSMKEADGAPSSLKSESKYIGSENKMIESRKESAKTSSVDTSFPIITPSDASILTGTPVQLDSARKPDLNSAQDVRQQAEISNDHIVEPNKPDLVSKPRQPVLLGPPQLSSEVQHRNIQLREDSHDLGGFYPNSVPELTSFDSLLLPFRLPAFHKPNSDAAHKPMQSVAMNVSESKKLDAAYEKTMPALPEQPPLSSEAQQTIIHSNRDKESMESTSKARNPVVPGSELKNAALYPESTGPALPGPPRMMVQAPQRSANIDEDDDLPEFDFSSTCGVSQAPVNKFPWPSHESQLVDAPQVSKQLLVEDTKNSGEHKPPAASFPKSIEVMQKPQVSSFPGIAYSALKAVDCISEKKPAAKAIRSLRELHTEKEVKIPASPKFGCSIPKKNQWDDDDDMPEWCPPDLESLDQPMPSTMRLSSLAPKPFSDISSPRPSIPAQAPSSFCPSQTQGFLQHSQLGLLGPCPSSGNVAILPQARPAAGPVRSGPRPPMRHHLRNPLRSPTSKPNIRPPSHADWRLPRC